MTVNDAMKRRLANMALLITGMIWGSGFVVMKNTLDSMSTNYILAIRFTIAALGLSYTLFTKGPVTFEKIKAGANLGLYIYGAFAVQTYGLMFTTAGKNALITAFYVVLVPLLLWIMQKRRPEGKVWMAAVMMIIGIALLTTDGGGSINIGDVLTLCCSLGYAIQIVLVDGYAKKYDLMQLTCLQFWFSALYGWIAALLFEQPPRKYGRRYGVCSGILRNSLHAHRPHAAKRWGKVREPRVRDAFHEHRIRLWVYIRRDIST